MLLHAAQERLNGVADVHHRVLHADGHVGRSLAVDLHGAQQTSIDVFERQLALHAELSDFLGALAGGGGNRSDYCRHGVLNGHPAIRLYLASLQGLRIGTQGRPSFICSGGVGHQQKAEAICDIQRLLGVKAQATHNVSSADVQLLRLSQRTVGFLRSL
ncbi:hypothetical protein D3C76_823720 [compost metagenome]